MRPDILFIELKTLLILLLGSFSLSSCFFLNNHLTSLDVGPVHEVSTVIVKPVYYHLNKDTFTVFAGLGLNTITSSESHQNNFNGQANVTLNYAISHLIVSGKFWGALGQLEMDDYKVLDAQKELTYRSMGSNFEVGLNVVSAYTRIGIYGQYGILRDFGKYHDYRVQYDRSEFPYSLFNTEFININKNGWAHCVSGQMDLTTMLGEYTHLGITLGMGTNLDSWYNLGGVSITIRDTHIQAIYRNHRSYSISNSISLGVSQLIYSK